MGTYASALVFRVGKGRRKFSVAQSRPFDLLVSPFWQPFLVKVPKSDHLLFLGPKRASESCFLPSLP